MWRADGSRGRASSGTQYMVWRTQADLPWVERWMFPRYDGIYDDIHAT